MGEIKVVFFQESPIFLECKNAYWGEESCGGPVERKCCRPPSTNPSTSSTESVPTVPQEPSQPTDTGMSTGAIVGIIVGSVAILGSVVGVSYYFGKNKSSGKKYRGGAFDKILYFSTNCTNDVSSQSKSL